jgi:hypothetical protein
VNAEMMDKMRNLFDRLLEQSKNETALIMNLKEQMELELSDIRAKFINTVNQEQENIAAD